MKITFTNLGPVKHAEVELGRLTLVCGENNTGKTFVANGIYGFLWFWHKSFCMPVCDDVPRELAEMGTAAVDMQPYFRDPSEVLEKAGMEFCECLPRILAAPGKRFTETRVAVDLAPCQTFYDDEFEHSFYFGNAELGVCKPKGSFEVLLTVLTEGTRPDFIPKSVVQRMASVLKDVLFRDAVPRPFIVSAERASAALFEGDLNVRGGRATDGTWPTDGSMQYPLPVTADVRLAQRVQSVIKHESFVAAAQTDVLASLENILGGEFHIDSAGILRFTPRASNVSLSMNECSNSVRSLLDLRLYLAFLAAKGDLLIVDGPELYLHPGNQRRVARLLARLVKLGVRVLLVTHSDYIVKELNLLMLMHSEDSHIRTVTESEKYTREETVDPNDVKLYATRNELPQNPEIDAPAVSTRLLSLPVNGKSGINVESIDDTIGEIKRIEDELLFGT